MERKIVTALIIFFLLLNFYPFIHGVISAPPDTVFLGTIHYPIDYLYYLSHITQGQDHILRTSYLSTTEPMPDLFIGWVYVLLGKIGSLLRISPIIMYQIGLLAYGFLFLIGVYLVIRELFPDSKEKRIFTFLLFMFSNTLPRIVEEGGKTLLAPYFSWYNYGEPFLRLSAVPHHLLIQAAILFTFLAFLKYPSSRRLHKKAWLGVIAVSSLVLASMQPVQWFLSGGVIFLFSGIKPHQFPREQLIKIFSAYLPAFVFIFFGIPVVLYLRTVFAQEPFVSTNLWEAAQSPILLQWQFIQYHGVAFLIGVLGIPFFLKTKNLSRFLIAFMTLLSLFLFFLPFSRTLPVLTFRYLSAVPILFYAACAIQILYLIAGLAGKFEPFVKSVFITFLFFLLVPLFFVQLNYKIISVTPSDYIDPNIFLNRDIYTLFLRARSISTSQDTFLISSPLQPVFQAIAGRRQYVVTKFSTIDFDRKGAELYAFQDTGRFDAEKHDFLKTNGITFVVGNNAEPYASYPFLKEVEKNTHLTIYKVTYNSN